MLAAMSWGAIGPVMVLLPAGTSPMVVAASRIGLGAVGFLPMAARRRVEVRALARPGARCWLAVGIVANVVMHGTFMLGLAWAGVAVGAMVHMGLCPVFTALADRMVTGARLTRRWLVSTVLAVGGCVALVLGDGAAAGPHLLLGVVAAAVSSLGYSLFTVCSARLIRQGHCSTSVMGVVFSGTAVCLFPLLLVFPVGWMLTARGCAVVTFLGLVATSGAYCLYGYGLRHTPSSAAAVLVLAEPATAALLAVAVLGEHLGWLGGAGLAVVFAALVMTAAPRRAGRRAPAIGPRHVRGSRPGAGDRPHRVMTPAVVVAPVRLPVEA